MMLRLSLSVTRPAAAAVAVCKLVQRDGLDY